MSETALSFRDPIAAALWQARLNASTIDPALRPAGGLPPERATEVAAEVYAALRQTGARQVGWKLAATDPRVQARFRTNAPFYAPVFDATLIPDGSTVSLGQLVAPIFEAEIGLRVEGEHVVAFPCVELADCRFPGWNVIYTDGTADFGLQGLMLFGEPGEQVSTVEVVVSHDGQEVARGAKAVSEAVESLRWLEAQLGTRLGADGPVWVATGSLIAPPPVRPGRWVADFGPFGKLTLTFEP